MKDFKFYYKDNPSFVFDTRLIKEEVIRLRMGLDCNKEEENNDRSISSNLQRETIKI